MLGRSHNVSPLQVRLRGLGPIQLHLIKKTHTTAIEFLGSGKIGIAARFAVPTRANRFAKCRMGGFGF
jgi:hypothetical protein